MIRSELKRTGFARKFPAEPKPVKGPKLRKCAVKSCRKEFAPARALQNYCSFDCAAIIGMDKVAKQKAKAARSDRVATKAKLERFKTRSDWMRDAQKEFNAYVRAKALRFRHSCISSGAPLVAGAVGGGFDCGHYRSVGSAPHLRFNLNNAWGQSKQDNRYGAGASFEYRRGLIARRGIEIVEALEANNEVRKFDITYLKRIKDIFSRKTKRMIARIE